MASSTSTGGINASVGPGAAHRDADVLGRLHLRPPRWHGSGTSRPPAGIQHIEVLAEDIDDGRGGFAGERLADAVAENVSTSEANAGNFFKMREPRRPWSLCLPESGEPT
jgi:hypothetical protein